MSQINDCIHKKQEKVKKLKSLRKIWWKKWWVETKSGIKVEKGRETDHIYSAMIFSVESERLRLMRSVRRDMVLGKNKIGWIREEEDEYVIWELQFRNHKQHVSEVEGLFPFL